MQFRYRYFVLVHTSKGRYYSKIAFLLFKCNDFYVMFVYYVQGGRETIAER